MITYNHQNFIADAIRGVLMQKIEYSMELIISNDASTDKTDEVIKDLISTYKGQIKIKYHSNSQNLGMNPNFLKALSISSGSFIALCEGDDYWTDPYKLQKQVDFLEANEDYAICFSGYKILNKFKNEEKIVVPIIGPILIEQLIKNNSFSTATVLFSAKYFKAIPDWFKKMHFGDWAIYLYILFNSKKKAYCLKDITAVYRIHAGGIHGYFHSSPKQLVVAYNMHIDFYKAINKYLFNRVYSSLIEDCIEERKKIIASLKKNYQKQFPLVLKKIHSFFYNLVRLSK